MATAEEYDSQEGDPSVQWPEGADDVECPIDGCDYSGSQESVEGHISGKKDEAHEGTGRDYRDQLRPSDGDEGGSVESGGDTSRESSSSEEGSSDEGSATNPDESSEADSSEETEPSVSSEAVAAGAAAGGASILAMDNSKYLVLGGLVGVVLVVAWLYYRSDSSESSEGQESQQEESEVETVSGGLHS